MHGGSLGTKSDRSRRSSLSFAHTFMEIDRNKSAFPVKGCWQTCISTVCLENFAMTVILFWQRVWKISLSMAFAPLSYKTRFKGENQ